jgi:hypothetical protein
VLLNLLFQTAPKLVPPVSEATPIQRIDDVIDGIGHVLHMHMLLHFILLRLFQYLQHVHGSGEPEEKDARDRNDRDRKTGGGSGGTGGSITMTIAAVVVVVVQ